MAMYGLIGNALVLPLVEFVVMPAAVFGVFASFFGLDAPIWFLMGQGIGFMLDVAAWVAKLPGAVRMIPSFGAGALIAMSLGLIWLSLWQSRLRWAGLAIALAGVALAFSARQPDLVIDARAQALAYRGEDGRLHALAPRGDAFAVAQWLAGDADPRTTERRGAPLDGRCDRLGCVGRLHDGRRIALVLDRRALAEDCARAAIVVTRLAVGDACPGPALVMDQAFFAARGAARVFATGGELRLETARNQLRSQRERLTAVHPLRQLKLRRQALEQQRRLLRALAPQHLLARGFSLLRNQREELVRSVSSLNPGDGVRIQLQDGLVEATVQSLVPLPSPTASSSASSGTSQAS
jgi:competence protein ComEC